MAQNNHQSYVYVGLAGEGVNIGTGGLYRKPDGDGDWVSIAKGLPPEPQVRALLVHPERPEVVYAGPTKGSTGLQIVGATGRLSNNPGTAWTCGL